MKSLPRTLMLAAACAPLLFAGCPQKPIAEEAADARDKDTRGLLAADLIGVDGRQLKNSADHLKAATEKHNEELQKAIDNAR